MNHLSDAMVYYKVEDTEVIRSMAQIRLEYCNLYHMIAASLAPSRSRSLALTHLEDSLMRAIQALAIYSGTPVDPEDIPE